MTSHIPEPETGQPIHGGQRLESRTKIRGSDLVLDRDAVANEHASYKYWVGVLPSCPRESIDCAGINFPKVNENIVPDPMNPGRKARVPVIGAIVPLTEARIRLIRKKIRQIVIRFREDSGAQHEPGTGLNVGDVHRRARKGRVITVPTEEELEARRKNGWSARPYVYDPQLDRPAADYMFAVLCTDQENGNRGEFYPEVLSKTGLEWPGEINFEDDDVSTLL